MLNTLESLPGKGDFCLQHKGQKALVTYPLKTSLDLTTGEVGRTILAPHRSACNERL